MEAKTSLRKILISLMEVSRPAIEWWFLQCLDSLYKQHTQKIRRILENRTLHS